MEKRQQKYNSIEFLRIIFTFAIIIFHIFGIIDKHVQHYQYCRHARVVVEFFFIASGFFLYSSCLKEKFIYNVIVKRFLRLWPVLFVAVVFVAVHNHIAFYKTLPAMVMLTSLGFKDCEQILGYCWFVYVLFWVSVFYSCLIYAIKDKIKLSLVILLLAYLGLLMLTQDSTMFVQTFKNLLTVFNGGVLRGIIGVGVGILIAMHFKDIKLPSNKILFTGAELFALSYLLAQLFFVTAKNTVNATLVFIILFSFLFVSFVNNLGCISFYLNKINLSSISKYCYCWYVMQCVTKDLLPLDKLSNNEYIILSLFVTTTLGILAYHLVEKPSVKFLSKIFLPQHETHTATESACEQASERERERVIPLYDFIFKQNFATVA